MNIGTYLPNELGEWAKGAKLNFSATLRAAVIEERERRTAIEETLAESSVHKLHIREDHSGRSYTARLHGTEIATNEKTDHCLFLTDDEQVVLFDGLALVYAPGDDVLRNALEPAAYVEAMAALGEEAIIDIGMVTS